MAIPRPLADILLLTSVREGADAAVKQYRDLRAQSYGRGAYDFDEDTLLSVARRLANGPRLALRYMKENLNRAVLSDFGDCSDIEVTHHVHTGTTQDHREAAQAFVDKREPTFTGR